MIKKNSTFTGNALIGTLFAASLFALVSLVMTMLAGATDIARDYAALLETQVRQGLWMDLLGNPLAWVCLSFLLGVAAVVVALAGYGLFLLHRSVTDTGESGS